MRCDVLAQGVVDVAKEMEKIKVPVVVRLGNKFLREKIF